ncbi:MAG: phosphatase PAP2 family protein [Geobacter sp.]|nr:phosphatase PAP2 family protein [Geobacter sp.]
MQSLSGNPPKPFLRWQSTGETLATGGTEGAIIFFLILLILFFSGFGWDLAVAGLFYAKTQGWVYGSMWPWRFLYEHGELPAYATAAGALLAIVCGLLVRHYSRYRKVALYFLLFVLIGPCLVVNVLLKDNWGRPRPCQVNLFGGTKQYLPVWEKGTSGVGKSFPCGHAAAGFTLISPYFLLRRRYPRAAKAVLLLGLGYGTLMGIARMTQGGHYLTDVIGAGVVSYLTGLWLSRMMGFGMGYRADAVLGSSNEVLTSSA